MSAGCPERAAVETPRGDIRAGEVLECVTRIDDCRPIEYLRVELDGHVLEVPEAEAWSPP